MLNLEDRIYMYEEAVEYISNYDDSSEIVNAFVNREAITNALERGAVLTSAQRTRLEDADAALRAALPTLARRFPILFAQRDDIPAVYWWWHLTTQA